MSSTASVIALLAKPSITAGKLDIEGLFFTRNNKVTTINMCSDFNFINKVRDNTYKPIVKQRKSLGFDCKRIWTGFHPEAIGLELDYQTIPNFYSYLIPKTIDICLSNGINPYFTAYTGINDPNHWPRLGDAIAKHAPDYCFLEYVNEWLINNYKPDREGRLLDINAFYKIDKVFCSHGSNGSQQFPVEPLGDFGDFHTNDAFEWQRKAGHNGWEIAISYNRPILASENTRDDKDGSVIHFEDAAKGITGFIAGGCFHSSQGKASEIFTGDCLTKAEAWCSGIKGIPSYCQRGYYERLDPNGYLRLYRKGGMDECLVPIRF